MQQQYVIYTKFPTPNLKITKNISLLSQHDKYIINVLGISLLFNKTSSTSYKITISNAPMDLKIENNSDYICSYDYSSINLFSVEHIKVINNNIKVAEFSTNKKKPITISSAPITPNYDIQVLNHDDIFLKMVFIKNIKSYSNIIKDNSIKKYSKIQNCDICSNNKLCFRTTYNKIACTRCIVEEYFTI